MRFYLSLVSPLLLPLLLILSSCSSGGGGGSDDTSNASNPLPLPFLSSLFPERGPVAGGTFVTVSGSNFLGTTQVRLGGISLSSFAVVSSSSLTFTVPSGSVGFAELEVVNAFGSSNPTTPLGFTRTTESWRLLSSSVPSPSPRFYSKAVYDSTRQRMLVFGGEFFDSVTFDSAVFGEVWALDLRNANLSSAIWTLLTPAVNATGFPTAFTEMALVYDSVRDRVLMTQGLRGDFTPLGAAVFALTFSSTAFNESGTWTRLSDIGSETPPARFTPGVAFSSTGDRLILLGGFDANFAGGTNGAGQFNDTWAFNLEGNSSGFWENLTPAVGTVPLAEAGKRIRRWLRSLILL
jgi:hypothetical protein